MGSILPQRWVFKYVGFLPTAYAPLLAQLLAYWLA